jgi:WD40 repeat protein
VLGQLLSSALIVWDLKTGEELAYRPMEMAEHLSFSADGNFIIITNQTTTVSVFKTKDLSDVAQTQTHVKPRSVTLNANGTLAMIGIYSDKIQTVSEWNIATGKVETKRDKALMTEWNQDGSRLAIYTFGGEVYLAQSSNYQPLFRATAPPRSSILAVGISADGKKIATFSQNSNDNSKRLLRVLREPTEQEKNP